MIEVKCPACGKLLRIPDEYRGQAGRCNGCGGVVIATEIAISPNATPPPKAIATDMAWTLEPAQSKTAVPLTQGEATAIDIAVSQRESVKAQWDVARAIRQQTTTQRLGCGCLVVILTAPVWIPLCIFVLGLGASLGFSTGGLVFLERYFPPNPPEPVIEYVTVEVPAPPPPPIPEPLSPTKAVYSDENLYHLERQCHGITTSAIPMTLSVAREREKQPCPICAPDQPATPPRPTVAPERPPVLGIQPVLPTGPEEIISTSRDGQRVRGSTIDGKYHKANCSHLPDASVSMALSIAQAKGMTACAVCKPPR